MKNEFVIRDDSAVIMVKGRGDEWMETIIDVEDLDKACAFPNTWMVFPGKRGEPYIRGVLTRAGQRRSFAFHRWIMDAPATFVVDHANGDTLNNRRSNIRIVSVATNNANVINPRRQSITGVLGVSYYSRKKSHPYVARIKVNKQNRHLGCFATIEDAQFAYLHAKQQVISEHLAADADRLRVSEVASGS